MPDLAPQFAAESARYLGEVHLERLERALQTLPPSDLWWAPHPRALSVGAILRHLEGNVRQWILAGLGGQAFRRARTAEFSSQERPQLAALRDPLLATLREAAALVAALDAHALARSHTIQGFEITALGAVYHVVEHLSWHVGQVVWIAKARAGAQHGLAFFDDAALEDL